VPRSILPNPLNLPAPAPAAEGRKTETTQ